MKAAHPYIAFTLMMTGIIATMCILLTQIRGHLLWRHPQDRRRNDCRSV